MQFFLGFVLEKVRGPGLAIGALEVGLLENLADALEGDGKRFEVFRLAELAQREQAFLRIDQVDVLIN
jgi:hypothetical protein